MREVFVRAPAGVILRDPRTGRPLSESGEYKSATPFWLRQIREGSALVGAPQTAVSVAFNGLSEAPDEVPEEVAMTGLEEPEGDA